MAGGRTLSFRKRKGSSPLHPPLRKETAFSRYFSGMGASYVGIAWLGRRADRRGLLECCMRFPGGGEQSPKRTRLCGAGFSRKAKPHTPPHRMNAPCAFRVGEQLPKRTRLSGAGFSRKAKPRTAPHCLKAACAFRVGEQLPKSTRLCGAGFSRKAKPRTSPHRMKTASAFRVGASNCRKERACTAMDFRARQAAHCTVSHECCKRFPGGGEQLPKSTRLCGAGFSRKARRQGEGVLEVRRAADDTALREKTSRPGAGFLAIARWGKAPFSERRPPPAFPSVPLVPPFLPRDAIRARELSPRALFLTCIG